MKITYKEVTNEVIKELRNDYLNKLIEPQELFLEMVIWDSTKYLININEKVIGYFILSKDNTLAEYYIIDNFLQFNDEIFENIKDAFPIIKAYSKSFDLLMVKNCVTYFNSSKVIGSLFRDFNIDDKFTENQKLKIRLATPVDLKLISQIKEGLFENDDEIKYVIDNENMFIYSLNEKLIGCGIFQQTIKGRNSYDIGMLVHPEYRNRGFGTYIIKHLKHYCLQNKWTPTCGCAIENTRSKKTLEKAGFISKYSMMEFSF